MIDGRGGRHSLVSQSHLPSRIQTTGVENTIDQSVLDDVIARVVEVADPEKIILFGSAARGGMTRNSDIDLLIIRKGGHSRRLVGQIYRRLRGVEIAVDAIVVSPEDVERYKDSHALVIKPALREGTVVYGGA